MKQIRVFALALALAVLCSGASADAAGYWCGPLQAYYPTVRSCPVAWQPVGPQSAEQPLAIPPAQRATDENPPAATARTVAAQSDQPTFPAPSSFVRGDVLDQWCKGSTTALLTAICGDDDLRALAVQRLYAFEEAKARLSADQQKTLIADQNGWAMSYPQTCGLNADVQPTLPLAPRLRDCLEKAGRARLEYLKDYGLPAAQKEAASPPAQAPAAAPAPAAPSPAVQNPVAASPPTPSAATEPQAAQPPAAAATPPTATATVPPATSPKPPPRDTGSAAAPHRNSSLIDLGDYARMGAMLIAVVVVLLWGFSAWRQGRSRRAGKTAETRR